MKTLILALFTTLFSVSTLADSLSSEMESLGGNKDLMKRVKAIDPNNRVRVVQKRSVDRNYRLEIGFNYGAYSGGDPYLKTDSIGGQLEFHWSPMFSVGARYASLSNSLTSEGERVFEQARALKELGGNPGTVAVDPAEETILGTISIYPFYGKLNLFDRSIAQFDIYMIGGAGQTKLGSGNSPTYTAGGGMGLWMSQHFSTRLEARWQGHQDEIGGQKRDLNQTIMSATIGFLL